MHDGASQVFKRQTMLVSFVQILSDLAQSEQGIASLSINISALYLEIVLIVYPVKSVSDRQYKCSYSIPGCILLYRLHSSPLMHHAS